MKSEGGEEYAPNSTASGISEQAGASWRGPDRHDRRAGRRRGEPEAQRSDAGSRYDRPQDGIVAAERPPDQGGGERRRRLRHVRGKGERAVDGAVALAPQQVGNDRPAQDRHDAVGAAIEQG